MPNTSLNLDLKHRKENSMTKEEAIKYLQQLYPRGGHCWLDEQRIEAIGMAIKALQEEPVSEELEEASKEWLQPQLDKSYANYGEDKMMELTHFDGYAMLDAIEFGAKWKEQQMMSKAIDGKVLANGMGNPILHLWDKGRHLIDKKVKVIVIEED